MSKSPILSWFERCWNIFRPARLQSDLERELSSHLIERADELQAAGMSEEEALRTARRQFGNYALQTERTRTFTSIWNRRSGICGSPHAPSGKLRRLRPRLC